MIPNLIVISKETFFENEAEKINVLFEEGMQVFHLRKPNSSKIEVENLLKKIKQENHPQIVLHQHFDLIKHFNINRLHQNSKGRDLKEREKFDKKKNVIWSSSFHSEDEIKENKNYDYGFLSPIFDSISKNNYPSKFAVDWKLDKKNMPFPIIALGGICLQNLEKVAQMNVDGIAVLGAIWNNIENSITSFNEINKQWKKYMH